MSEVIRGILPFLVILSIVLGIIICMPAVTLWLPRRDLRAMIVTTMDDDTQFDAVDYRAMTVRFRHA